MILWDQGRILEMTSISNNAFENVIKAIQEDRKNDEKSLIWDGNQATIIQDELDSENIMDGRSGEFRIYNLQTAAGITLPCFVSKNNSELGQYQDHLLVNDECEFKVETSNRYLSLIKLDINAYNEKKNSSLNDPLLIEPTDKRAFGLEESTVLTGIINTESNKNMIGFRLYVKGSKDDAFCLTYAGFGNYSDIKVEAANMFRMFMIRLK